MWCLPLFNNTHTHTHTHYHSTTTISHPLDISFVSRTQIPCVCVCVCVSLSHSFKLLFLVTLLLLLTFIQTPILNTKRTQRATKYRYTEKEPSLRLCRLKQGIDWVAGSSIVMVLHFLCFYIYTGILGMCIYMPFVRVYIILAMYLYVCAYATYIYAGGKLQCSPKVFPLQVKMCT